MWLVLSVRGPVLAPLSMSGLRYRGLFNDRLSLPGGPRLLPYLVFLCFCPGVGLSVSPVTGSSCNFFLGRLFLCLHFWAFLPSRLPRFFWFFQGVGGRGGVLPFFSNCFFFILCTCSLKRAFSRASRVDCFRVLVVSRMHCTSLSSFVSGSWGGGGWEESAALWYGLAPLYSAPAFARPADHGLRSP